MFNILSIIYFKHHKHFFFKMLPISIGSPIYCLVQGFNCAIL